MKGHSGLGTDGRNQLCHGFKVGNKRCAPSVERTIGKALSLSGTGFAGPIQLAGLVSMVGSTGAEAAVSLKIYCPTKEGKGLGSATSRATASQSASISRPTSRVSK